MTGETTSRGARTRFFEQAAALATPNVYDRTYSDDDMWETYFYFMERMLPVAEEANVRLQLHPNDPPLTHQASPGSSAMSHRSGAHSTPWTTTPTARPCSASAPSRKCRRRWHRRGYRGGDSRIRAGRPHHAGAPAQYVESIPNFQETFPDNGYLDLLKIVCALREVGFDGMITPDHILDCGDGKGTGSIGEAYALGYIRCLIQASEAIVGSS